MPSSRHPLVRLLSGSALLLALACKAPGGTAPSKPAEPYVPTLSLRPLTVRMGTNATQVFQAEINVQKGVRIPGSPVGWRVVEPGGGTITAAGLYTAPATPGTYHVQVRREDFKEITAEATVVVK
ncbi:MAG: hypothetical protein P4L11_06815 [Geothrix sp.]|nr:hypothetical protein [Geothrix sp.]